MTVLGGHNSEGEADEQALLETAISTELADQSGMAADLFEDLVEAPEASVRVKTIAAYHLGICRSRQGDWTGAVAALESPASQCEDDGLRRIARLDLAEVLMKSGSPKGALAWFERLLVEGVPDMVSRLHVRLRRITCQLAGAEKLSEVAIDELPEPGETIPAALAGAWFAAAYAFEASSDFARAAEWYERLLHRPGLPVVLEVDAQYRCGFVSEARLDWKTSVEHYENCVDAPRVYPFAQDLARLQLANLLYASEDYDGAANHYQILKFTGELSARQQAQARLRHARCLINCGDTEAGERELVLCCGLYPESEESVQAELLLADIYGERKDHHAAAACYQRVIQHPFAEPAVKALARMCIRQSPPM